MITVAIKDNGEKNVIQMTYEDLWRELKDLPGAEIIVVDDWFEVLNVTKNKFVCFVEADCLVSGGFFQSQIGLFKKDKTLAKLGVLGTATGVLNWANRVYGYEFGNNYSDGLVPVRVAPSNRIHSVQVAFIPGAIMRTKMLKKVLAKRGDQKFAQSNLVEFSVQLSLLFWELEDGPRVAINPNTTYVTTEKYPSDIGNFDIDAGEQMVKFTKAGIR